MSKGACDGAPQLNLKQRNCLRGVGRSEQRRLPRSRATHRQCVVSHSGRPAALERAPVAAGPHRRDIDRPSAVGDAGCATPHRSLTTEPKTFYTFLRWVANAPIFSREKQGAAPCPGTRGTHRQCIRSVWPETSCSHCALCVVRARGDLAQPPSRSPFPPARARAPFTNMECNAAPL